MSKRDNLAYKMIRRIVKYCNIVKNNNIASKFMTDLDYREYLSDLFEGEYDLDLDNENCTLDWNVLNDYIKYVPFQYNPEEAAFIKSLLEKAEIDNSRTASEIWEDSNYILAANILYKLKLKRINIKK